MYENYNSYLDNLNLDKLTSRLKLGGGEQSINGQNSNTSHYLSTLLQLKKITETNLNRHTNWLKRKKCMQLVHSFFVSSEKIGNIRQWHLSLKERRRMVLSLNYRGIHNSWLWEEKPDKITQLLRLKIRLWPFTSKKIKIPICTWLNIHLCSFVSRGRKRKISNWSKLQCS